MGNSQEIINRIHGLDGVEVPDKPWFIKQLKHDDAAVRHAAALALWHEFDAQELLPLFLQLLLREGDEDVAIASLGAVGKWAIGSRDKSCLEVIRGVKKRFDGASDAFQEAADDALLRVVYGLSAREIILQAPDRRMALLSAIDG